LSPGRFFFTLRLSIFFMDTSFTDAVCEKLRRHPKRIVFPEGDHPVVIRAAQIYYQKKLGVPILLGNREKVKKAAGKEGIGLDHIRVIDPENSSELPVFCERLERLERYRKMGIRDASGILKNPGYFGAMMLQYGQVDGMVGGLASHTGALIRPLMKLVKPLPGVNILAGCLVVQLPTQNFGENGVLFLADCGVIPEPTVEQLADIAVQTGLFACQVFGHRARVALLSFSTKGSAKTPGSERVARATELARQRASGYLNIDIAVDGEMQADAALVPEIGEVKVGPSLVAGKANVLIFPDLHSGNIAAKLIEHLAGATVYGQMLVGLTRPAAEVARSASPENVAAVAALVGLQSIEYRKLYQEHSSE
jgi:phosphate acetyltransferase